MARLRTALLAVVTGASALTAAQPAAADAPSGVLCGLAALTNDTLTGQSYEGTVSGGPLTHADASALTIRCRVTVNGVTVAASPSVVGTAAATTEGVVAYSAGDTDVVRICTDYTSNHGSATVCDPVSTIGIPAGTGQRSSHNTHAQNGGHRSQGGNPAPNPYRPRGTIEMSSTLLGIVNYSFTNFDPPFAQWTCPPATGTSVTCTPPPPPAGYTANVCANVNVVTNSVVPGTAYGTSACAAPPYATASSTGPSNTPSQSSASPNSSFPWTCAATTVQTVVWSVRCTVGP